MSIVVDLCRQFLTIPGYIIIPHRGFWGWGVASRMHRRQRLAQIAWRADMVFHVLRIGWERGKQAQTLKQVTETSLKYLELHYLKSLHQRVSRSLFT